MRQAAVAFLIAGAFGCAEFGCIESKDAEPLPDCCHGLGTCLPSSLVPEENIEFIGRDSCDSTSSCLPIEFVELDVYLPQTCRSTLDAEGRCLPNCLPIVSAKSEMLPQGECPEHYLCAPCYDPFSSEDTGLCGLGIDPGPTDPPVIFDRCCHGRGWCIPTDIVPEDHRSRMGADSCWGNEPLLCVPDEFLDEEFVLDSCRSTLGAEGRCAPICLPEIADQKDDLPQDICPAYYRCAPCYDPDDGEATGLCELGGDPGPSFEPVVFETCCDGLGRCIPEALMPGDQQSHFGLDNCPSNLGLVCVPDVFMEEGFTPAPCRGPLHAEGRCVPECLPEVAEEKDYLYKDTCPDNHLCAPCYDPFSGDATGLCELGDDPGPTEPPVVFNVCCNGQGYCIPPDLVPEEDRQHLGSNTCPRNRQLLCVPEEFLEPDFALDSCRSTLGAEGRCAPICLPEVADQMNDLPQDSCPAYHRCAPCYDPLSGESTGLCELGGDPGPSLEPVVFETCCDDLGRCVPQSLVPEDQQSHLGLDICPSNLGLMCVPEVFLEEGFIPTTCHGVSDAEGRCVPACLPEIAAERDLLYQDVCPDKHLCAPCYDPFTGDVTGLCELGEDPGPAEPPVTFDTCCGGIGDCVPETLVPAEQQDKLGEDICPADQGLKCVPSFMFEEATPLSCYSILDAEGRCLPACLPDVAEQAALLPQDICPAGHLCSPCYDLYTGAVTGACSFPDDSGPKRPPVTFRECCNELGTCLPNALIPTEQQALLGEDTCPADKGLRCVPDVLQDDGFIPITCTSLAELEGRCLPECLPAVITGGDLFLQQGCPPNTRCAPCYDPFTGATTRACELPGDPGPQNPPVVFDKCCESDGVDIGTCVPSDIVPSVFADQLQQDSCSGIDELCAPDSVVLDPTANGFTECTAGGLSSGESGVCVPGCYLEAMERLLFSRTSCDQGEHCVPCEFGGEPTGVCP